MSDPIALGFYADSDAEVPLDGISMGEVWRNQSAVKVVYVKNLEDNEVKDLAFDINRTDILLEGPQRLRPGEIEALTITWSPTKESIGIKTTINITGTLIIGAN
jgi:hypothetical protein